MSAAERCIAAHMAGLDRRSAYWHWDEVARRLCVQEGPAAEAARRLPAKLAPFSLHVLAPAGEGRVSVSRTALRAGPGHAAEQISQLRLGDPFTVWTDSADGEWRLGAGSDGYPGWLRAWHLAGGAGELPEYVLTARSGAARNSPGGELVTELSFGTRIAAAAPAESGWLPWSLPDGRSVWTSLAELEPCAIDSAGTPPLERILDWGLGLLGVPYEWGGGSSWGIDCSGLVQLLFGAAGLELPRDSDLQALRGEDIPPGGAFDGRPGDLLFYGEPRITHVGIALGEGRLLHSRAWVRVDRLDAEGGLSCLSLRSQRRFNSIAVP